VRASTAATSSRSKTMPASCAIAGMCSAALVEPAVAATTAQAFFQRLAGDDVARTRAAVCNRPHDERPGAPREAGALGVGAGNH